jgi:hypothetical protein
MQVFVDFFIHGRARRVILESEIDAKWFKRI